MKYGYARVSTSDQNPNLQTDALKVAGCQKIFIDKISGTKSDRPELNKLKEQLREGDTIVVWRLDRLGRSLKDLIEWVNYLEKENMKCRFYDTSLRMIDHLTKKYYIMSIITISHCSKN